MILLLNGPFGIGKTTLATRLVARLPDAMLYDPEVVGAALRHLVRGVDAADDFQDLAAWPAAVVANARALREAYGRSLVVPMCLWRRDRFAAITEGLRRVDPDLACFRLTASEATLRARILGRPDAEGPHAWCLAHLASGLAAARDPRFGTEVSTEGRDPDEVAAEVLRVLALPGGGAG